MRPGEARGLGHVVDADALVVLPVGQILGLEQVSFDRDVRHDRKSNPSPDPSGCTIAAARMPSPYPHLLEPIDFGHTQLRNRVVMGSMHVKLEDRASDIKKLAA